MLPFSLAKVACLRVAVSRGGLLACTCGAGPARAVVRFSERFFNEIQCAISSSCRESRD
jgi:hypothetical protein